MTCPRSHHRETQGEWIRKAQTGTPGAERAFFPPAREKPQAGHLLRGVCPVGPHLGAWEAVACLLDPRKTLGSPGGCRGGTSWAGKEPPAPGRSTSALGGSRRLQPYRRARFRLLGAVPSGCCCLRVNRACFPFTPSGSVFMKHFLLLALWEYSFLARTAHG